MCYIFYYFIFSSETSEHTSFSIRVENDKGDYFASKSIMNGHISSDHIDLIDKRSIQKLIENVKRLSQIKDKAFSEKLGKETDFKGAMNLFNDRYKDEIFKNIQIDQKTLYYMPLVKFACICYLINLKHYIFVSTPLKEFQHEGINLSTFIFNHLIDKTRTINSNDLKDSYESKGLCFRLIAYEIINLINLYDKFTQRIRLFSAWPDLIHLYIDNFFENEKVKAVFPFKEIILKYINTIQEKVGLKCNDESKIPISQMIDAIYGYLSTKIYPEFDQTKINYMVKFIFTPTQELLSLIKNDKNVCEDRVLNKFIFNLCKYNTKENISVKNYIMIQEDHLKNIIEEIGKRSNIGKIEIINKFICKATKIDEFLQYIGIFISREYNPEIKYGHYLCKKSKKFMLHPVGLNTKHPLIDYDALILDWLNQKAEVSWAGYPFEYTIPETNNKCDIRIFITNTKQAQIIEEIFRRCEEFVFIMRIYKEFLEHQDIYKCIYKTIDFLCAEYNLTYNLEIFKNIIKLFNEKEILNDIKNNLEHELSGICLEEDNGKGIEYTNDRNRIRCLNCAIDHVGLCVFFIIVILFLLINSTCRLF